MTETNIFVSPLEEITLLEGSIFKEDETSLVGYWPVEASKYMMRILVEEDISLNTFLWIRNNSVKLKVQVDHIEKNFRDSAFHLISLSSVTFTGSLESTLHETHEVAKHTSEEGHFSEKKPLSLTIRSPRFCPAPPVIVIAKTFGSLDIFKFMTVDLSKSGMLMTETDEKAPFIGNTIIELNIDPEGIVFESSFECLGKIVRKDSTNTKAKFGVQLIDLPPELEAKWEQYIASLEYPTIKSRR